MNTLPKPFPKNALNECLDLEYGAALPERVRTGRRYPVFGSNGVVGRHSNFLVPGPGIVMGRKGSVGEVCWSTESYWPIDTAYYVIPKGDANLRWLYWLLKWSNLKRLDAATGVPGLNRGDVYALMEHQAPPPDQIHIAGVLDTVDEAISNAEAVISKLRHIHAGLLHNLLTRGLDAHGQLRDPVAHPEKFQESPLGRIPKDWECKRLKDLVPPNRRITYGIVQPGEFDPNGILLIRGQDYISGWASQESFFKVALSRHESYRRSLTKAGDLLICIVGATTGAVAQVPGWIDEANITQTTARVVCEPNKLVARFALYVLRSELGQKQVRRYVKGSAQPGLNLQDVEMFWTPVPNTDEQRVVADILDNHVANEISASSELKKLRQLKSGLMTDLLTGRVRVPETLGPTS